MGRLGTSPGSNNVLTNSNSFNANRTNISKETIPESPRTESISSFPVRKKGGADVEAPALNPDKQTDHEEPKTKMLAGGPTDKAAVKNGALYESGGFGESLNGADSGKPKAKAHTKEAPKSTASKTKAAPIVTAAKAASKPAKSPTVKTPTTPTITQHKPPTKTAEKKVAEPTKTATPKASVSATSTKPTASTPSSTRKLAPVTISPANTGFVKPKVKSPTRPVKLPPGLTTHTAASGSKVNVPRSLSRQSGSLHSAHPPVGRSPSRASISTVASTATGKNLKRQSSVIGRPRPSLGPPPKQPARDHPPTKRESAVDEGFLARMMRPTQASSSKTHDKAPVTPPRKVAAPVKKTLAKDVHHVKKDPVVRKLVPKVVAPAAAPEKPKEETSAAKEIAPVVEQTASAEEAISVAKEVEGDVALPEEKDAEPEVETQVEEETPVEEPTPVVQKDVEIAPAPEQPESQLEESQPAEIPRASEAAPEESHEPEIEEAAEPLLNGDHKETEENPTEEPVEEAALETEPEEKPEPIIEAPIAEEHEEEEEEEEEKATNSVDSEPEAAVKAEPEATAV
ncbi:putative mucin-7 precursor protein [Phaeoacremonium minimum UCRPA7]|uniref:Putative mucin-7 protein n=1 Tax=Phaeoacremonium minimum (strain UCR-PA7) TaxID=1286976 RepID=R8BHK9_PHAM7|nr:putative mucin-7 precursor protein [Phaeoacremonium minimum UCRPA7]EON98800.1 putative mucin-7 precursor protein [Phaeoacremonium minimum UCRPA7]